MTNLLALHRDLIAIPSVSHSETEIADFVFSYLTQNGITPTRIGNNIIAQTSDETRLLLNSHLDTVPPTMRGRDLPGNPLKRTTSSSASDPTTQKDVLPP
ncbi:hypothetical protein CCB80_12730 [Armatimonadetes bacterium Uphvl-Ar1]|nr:hypothetical protein CCB80_12730 [Armatimonadetes bacterium Uphvl-Ar1]